MSTGFTGARGFALNIDRLVALGMGGHTSDVELSGVQVQFLVSLLGAAYGAVVWENDDGVISDPALMHNIHHLIASVENALANTINI